MPLAAELAGKPLVDVANAVRTGPDGFATELLYPGSSLAERLQAKLPASPVVKTLNTLGPAELMARPERTGCRATAFLSGDDPDAKRLTGALLTDLGWPEGRIIDLGALSTAGFVESFILLVRPLVGAFGPVPFGLAIAVGA